MDMDKTPHLADIEYDATGHVQETGFTELQRALIEEIVNRRVAEHGSDKRWYDDLGCAVVVLILAAAWVVIHLADKGVIG